jgi:hypothetical protein
VQVLYGRLSQIEPTRARLGMMQLPVRAPMAAFGSMAVVRVVMRMTTLIRLVISLLSMMVCFAVPMLRMIERLTVLLRFVLPMLHVVTIPMLL